MMTSLLGSLRLVLLRSFVGSSTDYATAQSYMLVSGGVVAHDVPAGRGGARRAVPVPCQGEKALSEYRAVAGAHLPPVEEPPTGAFEDNR